MFAHPLARKIAILFAIKLVIILAFFVFFFGPSHRPHVTADTISGKVFGIQDPRQETKP